MDIDLYDKAQQALTTLKVSVARTLSQVGGKGLRNSQIGRALGIYGGHKGHQGHISRTILHLLELEGIIRQDAISKKWFLRSIEEMDERSDHEEAE